MAKAKKVTDEKANEAMNDFVTATNELLKLKAERKQEELGLINQYSANIVENEEKVEQAKLVLESYADQNKEKLFNGAKSTTFGALKIGFRKATAKLALAEGFDWDKVKTVIGKKFPLFVKKVEQLDKKKILDGMEDEKQAKKLAAIGIVKEQKETFFVKVA